MSAAFDAIILGGGYAGLAAGLRLARRGLRPQIIEALPTLGGLGGISRLDGIEVETFYHHYKPEDVDILELIQELGLGDHLVWRNTRMGFYIDGQILPLSGSLDLLRFRPLSFPSRIRFGLGVLRARLLDGESLEGLSASEWVVRTFGREVHERLMKPMLLNKFGIDPSEISAGFLQGRIKGLSTTKKTTRSGERYAYLEGGLAPLAERMAEKIRAAGEIRTAAPLARLARDDEGFTATTADGRSSQAPAVINTLPLHVFEKLERNFPFESSVRYQSVVCAIFSVEEPLTDYYWINILDPEISFRVLVNQSRLGHYDSSIVYCANYLPPGDRMFDKSDEEILALYQADLQKLFGRITVRDCSIARTRYATPVFDRGFSSRTAGLDQVQPGLIFAGNIKIYPRSRTVSSVIATGYQAADQVAAG